MSNKLICPVCKSELTPAWVEHEPGKFMFVYLCDCSTKRNYKPEATKEVTNASYTRNQ